MFMSPVAPAAFISSILNPTASPLVRAIDFWSSVVSLSACSKPWTNWTIKPSGPNDFVIIGPKALNPAWAEANPLENPLIPLSLLAAALPVRFPTCFSNPNCLIFSAVRPLPPLLADISILADVDLAASLAFWKGSENLFNPGIAFVISDSAPNVFTPKFLDTALEVFSTSSKLSMSFLVSLTCSLILSAILLLSSSFSLENFTCCWSNNTKLVFKVCLSLVSLLLVCSKPNWSWEIA